jgi:non-ribosomal peptide synthetase component E (peptide arylation enzyme)
MEARLAPVAGGEGAEGEILLRGAFVFCGYHRDDEATRASFDADGWFRTGDLGRLDAEGYLTVTGRAKNTIIRGGLKIQAEEVENLLAGMPGVVKVVLVPVPDARLGERVAAWVEPEAGRTLQLGDICAFLEERGVSKFKWPERLLLVERIPLNPVGKIDRNTLTRMAVAEDAALGSASTGKAKHAMAAAAPAPR